MKKKKRFFDQLSSHKKIVKRGKTEDQTGVPLFIQAKRVEILSEIRFSRVNYYVVEEFFTSYVNIYT